MAMSDLLQHLFLLVSDADRCSNFFMAYTQSKPHPCNHQHFHFLSKCNYIYIYIYFQLEDLKLRVKNKNTDELK